APERQRRVQRRLTAHGREKRVRALLLDDLRDDLRGNGFDISRVGEVGVCHDRRRVGIDQDDPVAFLLERLAGLRARIVEFTRLADNDRSGANNQDRGYVGAFGHGLAVTWSGPQKKGAPWRVLGTRAGSTPRAPAV